MAIRILNRRYQDNDDYFSYGSGIGRLRGSSVILEVEVTGVYADALLAGATLKLSFDSPLEPNTVSAPRYAADWGTIGEQDLRETARQLAFLPSRGVTAPPAAPSALAPPVVPACFEPPKKTEPVKAEPANRFELIAKELDNDD